MKLKLRETFDTPSVGRVDRDGSIIRDVKVLGLKSGNGRRYAKTAVKKAAKLYEGTHVFFNHPTGDDNGRRFEDRFGRLVNVREASDGGLVADLPYNPKHPYAEQFLWFAENDPAGMGLSHNAAGNGVREQDGGVLVEEITHVHSVDIVDTPATNLSLYEQMDDTTPLSDPAAPPVDTANAGAGTDASGDEIGTKLGDLAADFAKHPDWDKATKLKKLKQLVELMDDDAEDDSQYEGTEDAAEPDMAKDEDADKVMEQLAGFKSPAIKAVRTFFLRENRRKLALKSLKPDQISATFLEQLAAAPKNKIDALIADRKALAFAAGAETPRTAPKPAAPKTPAEIAAEMFG